VATEKCEKAKAEALAGYLDPGPGHLNCAQTVMLDGLLVMEEDPGLTGLAAYLGGGMVRMGQVCGALSGAVVALGLRDQLAAQGKQKGADGTFGALQQLFRDFEAEFGAVSCKELLGCDISTPEGFREAKRQQALSRCPEYVAWACDRLNEILEKAESNEKAEPEK